MALSTPPQKRLGYRDESYPASCLQPRGYYGLIFSGTELDSHSECTSILRHRRTIQDCPIRYPILLNIAWAMVNSLFKSTFANDPQSSLLPSGTRSTMPLMLHWSRIHRWSRSSHRLAARGFHCQSKVKAALDPRLRSLVTTSVVYGSVTVGWSVHSHDSLVLSSYLFPALLLIEYQKPRCTQTIRQSCLLVVLSSCCLGIRWGMREVVFERSLAKTRGYCGTQTGGRETETLVHRTCRRAEATDGKPK